ncbi:MAG: DEAD/DEAH box helicase [Gammaproteobacteria bacterium AqS3]|nr:DEAD/DEAH box helicase [Gammaproteobacteria bacterium AqS3]
MSTKFFTNKGESTVLDKFRGVFEHADINEFDVLVGYFRSTGYFRLRPSLEGVEQIRILVGIDVDAIIQKYKARGLKLIGGAKSEEARSMYIDELINEIEQADYDKELEESVRLFVRDIESRKVQIRAHPKRKLHAKIYIFRPGNFNEHSGGEVITGSSNLTEAGLGIGGRASNYEFNVSLRDYDDIRFATDEFEELWKDGVELLCADLNKAIDKTHLGENITPYEIYIKFLIEHFNEQIEFDPDNVKDLPDGFKKLSYQLDAVQQGLNIIRKHRGVFLADVVGLGKTITAIMLARELYEKNDSGEPFRVLIVAPPAIMPGWRDTVEQFQLPYFDYMSSGSLHKVKNARKYSLVIIDEAHKFRNKNSAAYERMENICKTPTQFGNQKKVILLSATPLNNRPEDLLNQLLLFQDGNGSTLNCGDFGSGLTRFFKPIIREYARVINDSSASDVQEKVDEMYQQVRTHILEPITVRRTRRDLQNIKSYAEDLRKQGIVFPKSNKPESLLYELPEEVNKLYDETLRRIAGEDESDRLNYARHRMIEFLNPETRQDYVYAERISEMLTGIIKTLMVKRLDSSFNAIYETLRRFLRSSESLLNMKAKDVIYLAPYRKISEYIDNGREEELDEILAKTGETDPGVRRFQTGHFQPEYWKLVEQDCKILADLVNRWEAVIKSQMDPKSEKLIRVMKDELFDMEKNPEQKLVIFSESLDTTTDLECRLKRAGFDKILHVNSSNRNKLQKKIKENFDANQEADNQSSDYDIIITTEVLSEGINLHRANIIVNYDTPWNSTKLIQRIGRINRIGSKAGEIFIYNFLPTEKVEGDLNLRRRAHIKLQAFHSALGKDAQILSSEEAVGSFSLYDKDITAEDEYSEELQYLEVIRRFRKDSPEDYRRIKALPMRVRVGVDQAQYQGGTFVFLRNANFPESFVLVQPGQGRLELSRLTFLESAKMLECEPAEKSVPLHQEHHRHVQEALKNFQREAETALSEMNQEPELELNHRRAIDYLKALSNLEHLGREDKSRLNQAVELIKLDRFANLKIRINQLRKNSSKSSVKPDVQLRSTLQILGEYLVDLETDSAQYEEGQLKYSDIKPRIVIAQSYS